jgi:glycosyltransferase involved in cell wall biosynthesis
MMPKLSIITINFNNLKGLKRTLDSVIKQTLNDFEYLVIDGGSIDGSAAYIESQSKNIDYWVSEPDKGIYNAMNKGIVKAKGDYLLFLNSGDELFDNEVIEKCFPYFDDGYTCLSGSIVFFDGDTEVSVKDHPEKMTFKYIVSRIISHQATFIKKESFLRYGLYNEENEIVSDSEFFFKIIALNGESYKSLDIKISKFYYGGISGNVILGLKEMDNYLKKMLPYVYNNEEDTFIFNLFRVSNRRVNYLKDIEKSVPLRKITTIILMAISKLSKMIK